MFLDAAWPFCKNTSRRPSGQVKCISQNCWPCAAPMKNPLPTEESHIPNPVKFELLISFKLSDLNFLARIQISNFLHSAKPFPYPAKPNRGPSGPITNGPWPAQTSGITLNCFWGTISLTKFAIEYSRGMEMQPLFLRKMEFQVELTQNGSLFVY